nr:transporter [Sphingomonas bacterium]
MPARAATGDDLETLRAELIAQKSALDEQQKQLNAQRVRLQAIEDSLLSRMRGTGAAQVAGSDTVPLPPSPPPAPPASAQAAANAPAGSVQTVGEAPTEQRQVQVAVLAEQGGVITRAGRLTLEPVLEYARADRNRFVFRGVQVINALAIGVFDINEARQDVLTAAGVARLGVTNRFEINARVPYVYRSDKAVVTPIANPTPSNTQDASVRDSGIGDIDFGARYQFTDGRNGAPYLIGGIQAIAPTGTSPFAVERNTLGIAREASTGAGFWGITPNLTAILPTDPAVLFATVGYTVNIARNIDRMIGTTLIERVKPGDTPSASVGIALSLNPRTSLSLGYGHSWSMGTKMRFRTTDANGVLGDEATSKTRDLQLGRLLFGVSYRTSPRTTINWNLEMGATEDATDLRTTLRIPLTFEVF